MKHYIFFLSLLFWTAVCVAQTDNEIKGGGYYYGEADGEDETEAYNAAISQMSNSISTLVSSYYKKGYVDGVESEESVIESFSVTHIRGVQKRVTGIEPAVHVLVWVGRDAVDKMFEDRKLMITSLVEGGERAEKNLQIDDALRNYYWALMMAKVTPESITFEEKDIKVYLNEKIASVLANIKASITECRNEGEGLVPMLSFTYAGQLVSSLKVRYNNGESFVGPVTVKDGRCELEMRAFPADSRLHLQYEYRFVDETSGNDDIASIYKGVRRAPKFDGAYVDLQLKQDKNKLIAQTKDTDYQPIADTKATIAPITDGRSVTTKPKAVAADAATTSMQNVMHVVEEAVRKAKPTIAKEHFTPEAYQMLETLLAKTGRISLMGKNQNYEFVKVDDGEQYLGRFMNVKIKFNNGKTFTEKLVLRFNGEYKVESLAMGLTQRAEDDIFNARKNWPEVSRYTVLQFMEDYQTAFLLKRQDYLEKIFSNKALIIVGTMLVDAPAEAQAISDGIQNTLKLGSANDQNATYKLLSKEEYMHNVKNSFKNNEYVHLTLQDNATSLITNEHLDDGRMFAIQINQMYNSSTYNDQGYLTLCFDVSKKPGLIYVRLWQPTQINQVVLKDFIDSLPM